MKRKKAARFPLPPSGSLYSQEQLRAMGVNDSMIHVDFMIGCRDLNITGITADGRKIPVFRFGEWCF